MNKVYIFGHKKPDTDSVTSAINLSYLKNKLGLNTVPMTLGELNNETKFVLEKFKVETPSYLNDVRLQISDLNFRRKAYLQEKSSILDAYNYMTNNLISALPIVNSENELTGIVSTKDIIKNDLDGDFHKLKTSYKNIELTLNAKSLNKFDDEIIGNIIVASYRSTKIINNSNFNNNTILIVGDRHSVIEHAIESKIKMIILTGGSFIKDEHLEKAKNNNINIVKTEFDTFKVSKLIGFSNYVSNIIISENLATVNINDDVKDFIDYSNKNKFSNYPVINKDGKCEGVIKLSDIYNKIPKKVILVDHNEFEQSADGIDEADILEIVDHHRIGNDSTNVPINFRNMTVGSTNTIIYLMFRENNIEIPHDIAGLMISGILSDTLILTSPTATDIDKKVVNELAEILDLDFYEYGIELLDAGSSLKGRTEEEVIFTDFKNYFHNDLKIGIGQIFTTTPSEIENNIEKYKNTINNHSEKHEYEVFGFFVTDIIHNGSYIIFNDKAKSILEEAFEDSDFDQWFYIDGCVSRKKQMVPKIIDSLSK